MNLLALPLERDQIFSIKRRFPGFSGKVPEEAAFWSEADLEAYFGSNGLEAALSRSDMAFPAGFPKCSSSHIFRILQSHPNTVTFGKQVGSLPRAELEFEMAAFAIARTLQIPGKPVISACTGMPLKVLKECKRLVGYIRGKYDNSTAAVLVITDIFFLEKKVLVLSGMPCHSPLKIFFVLRIGFLKQALARRWTGKGVKLLFVVREPADYLWAAYNFWILPGEPKGLQDDWTDTTKHTRSPELFHDLVVADGKMPAWQPRSNKVTGLWFNLIQDAKNASATTLVLKSEALRELIGMRNLKPSSLRRITHAPVPHIPVSRTPLSQTSKDFTDHVSATLEKMASFLGVSASGFPLDVALGKEVQRLRGLEGIALEAPVLLEKQRDWYARFWNLEFFKRDCGHDYWFCRPQFPAFECDEAAIDQMTLHTNIADFVEFTRTVQRMDRKCDQEKSIAFPRLILDGYAPFFGVLRKFFDECWTKLGPDGLSDLTPRLAHAFAHAFDLQDPMETLSRFYKVTLAATGSITRLHVENAGAHLWFNQIEGRRVFFLFPPSESRKLYEETGGPMQETSGFATRVSGVDLFAPSAKRHPLFAEASCQVAVLYLGQTLVIPSGWWWYSVTLDPSVTLWHQFWTDENKSQFPEIAWEYFNYQKMTPEFWAALPRKIDRLREKLAEEE
ncbi:Hspbap1 [Symbiodinium sp. KB8]|nr:Hspbap1 [Symbiodinium sp. KB8]